MRFLIIALLFSKLHFGGCKKTLPLLLIDHQGVIMKDNIYSYPLSVMDKDTFSDIVQVIADRASIILVFIEDSLSHEDLSSKDDFGTPFEYLRSGLLGKFVRYIPAVVEPYTVLYNKLPPGSKSTFYIDTVNYWPQVLDKNEKYFYFFFKDESVLGYTNILRKHDTIIKEIYSAVTASTKGPVVAFYSGLRNPVELDDQQFEEMLQKSEEMDSSVTVASNRGLFFFKGVTLTAGGETNPYNIRPHTVTEKTHETVLRTSFGYPEFELYLEFVITPKKWSLDTMYWYVNNQEVGRTTVDTGYLPWYRSYVCDIPLKIYNKKDQSMLNIPHIQVQPYDYHTSRELRSAFGFNEPSRCGIIITEATITSLLLASFLLILAISAVIVLSMVQANDRYDDAKKPFRIMPEGGGE